MVVQGLEYFFKKKNLFIETNIKELCPEKISGGDFQSKPVIILDASSVAHMLHSDLLDNVCNGNVKKLKTIVRKFLTNILDLDIKLIVVLRGSQTKTIEKWVKSRSSSVKLISEFLSRKNLNGEFNYLNENIFFGICDYIKDFLQDKYEVLVSEGPTHIFIANLLKKVPCFAVLGQDSNFVIYDNIKTYADLKHLNFHNLNCSVYDKKRFLRILDLDPKHLPLFASLAGNSVVESQSLADFRRKLCNRKHNPSELFFHLADEIRQSNGNLESIVNKYNLSNIKLLIEKSIRMYEEIPNNIEEENTLDLSDIQCLAQENIKKSSLYRCISELLIHKIYKIFPVLEDLNNKDIKFCEEIFKDLRKSFYEIIFSEGEKSNKEISVQEYYLKGIKFEENLQPRIIKVSTSNTYSLIDLWTRRDSETEQKRWDIFGSVVSMDSQILKMIPTLLFIPVTALRYLHNLKNKFEIISEDFEIESLLIVAIKMAYFSDEEESLSIENPNFEAIDLSTKFLNCCFYLSLINLACGEICDCKNYHIFNYFDGILFQDVYMKMKTGVKGEEFFEEPQKDLIKLSFLFLKKIVCNEL